MKTKLIFSFLLLCFTSAFFAQTNDEQAREKYIKAKEAYNNGKYQNAVSYLVDAKLLLGKTNMKIQPLLAKCFAKLENWSIVKIAIKDYYALNPDKNLVEYAEIAELEIEAGKHLPKETINQTNLAKSTNTAIKSESGIQAYTDVEVIPEFPGKEDGLKTFLSAKLRYPDIAAENNIQGTVIVRFIVMKDGSIDDIKIVQPLDPACDREVIRLVKSMPKWTPGMQKGVPVAVWFTSGR
jgi:TonB family protein